MTTPHPTMDRRAMLRWVAAAAATTGLVSGCADGGQAWPQIKLAEITAAGYGRDPDLQNAAPPWPLTLTAEERATVEALCDMILPAEGDAPGAVAMGVPAFFDEWVSAPYADQQEDRALIVPGLVWLDRQAKAKGATSFAAADASTRAAIVDPIAYRERAGDGEPGRFFRRFRALTLGAYYTTPEGWADMGYMGNTPVVGEYPGPTPEALAHVDQALASLNLKRLG